MILRFVIFASMSAMIWSMAIRAGRTAFDHHAVHRDRFGRADAQPVTHDNGVERYVRFESVGLNATRRLRCEIQ